VERNVRGSRKGEGKVSFEEGGGWLDRRENSTEKRIDDMSNIPYRLSSRNSFNSSLRFSHIPLLYIIKSLSHARFARALSLIAV